MVEGNCRQRGHFARLIDRKGNLAVRQKSSFVENRHPFFSIGHGGMRFCKLLIRKIK
jgi:hypothetical protein